MRKGGEAHLGTEDGMLSFSLKDELQTKKPDIIPALSLNGVFPYFFTNCITTISPEINVNSLSLTSKFVVDFKPFINSL